MRHCIARLLPLVVGFVCAACDTSAPEPAPVSVDANNNAKRAQHSAPNGAAPSAPNAPSASVFGAGDVISEDVGAALAGTEGAHATTTTTKPPPPVQSDAAGVLAMIGTSDSVEAQRIEARRVEGMFGKALENVEVKTQGAGAIIPRDAGGATLGTGKVGARGRGTGEAAYGGVGAELSGSIGGLRGSAMGAAGLGRGGGGLSTSGSISLSQSVSREPALPPPSTGGTFQHAGTNPIVDTREDALSTFAIDVDTGSWTYAKRFLAMGRSPAEASVRVEEFVNALHYAYAGPSASSSDAFAIHIDAAPSPFTVDHHVVRVALQGRRVKTSERKAAHVTFLVDVSGSMNSADKLPWARDAIRMAVKGMRDDDTVAIATYAGDTRLALRATKATDRDAIFAAVDGLVSGGGTNMGSGMELAYREANKHLGSGRTSRVIVLSDGDANIGRTDHSQILDAIRGYVSEGITMSTVGFGTGNYNDHLMEQLADAGNGNYTYVDSKETMKRVFVDELTSTLEVIAQDAKIQVEWNPNVVRSYRLLGYENRDIADADFRNDKKDAGEIGAGHAVTALYEVKLVEPTRTPDEQLGVVRVRHKVPRHEKAGEVARIIAPEILKDGVDSLDDDAQAALGMALAAEIMRGSEHAAGLTLGDAAGLLRKSANGKYAMERREAAELFARAHTTRAVAAR